MSSEAGLVGTSMIPMATMRELNVAQPPQPIPLDIVSSNNRSSAVELSLSAEAAKLLSRT